MNKLYTKQTWHNDTTPAINEDNLNHMEDGIDAIDSRLVEISGTLMETIPEILEMYDDIETLTKNPPYIGTNGDWYVWDTESGAYVDSGVDASITVTIADVTMLPVGSQPYVTNTGTNTDPVFHLFIPYGSSIGGVTGVKGDAESTYRTGDVNLTKANIGLGNVDNTSDANKPVSTATQTALDGKVPNTRTVNGHALSSDVSVTASDVGLGNVPNVTTDNQTPTVTQASTRANIATGDTLKTIIGKIKKFFADLGDLAFLNKDSSTGANNKFLRGDGTWDYVNLLPFESGVHNRNAFITSDDLGVDSEATLTLTGMSGIIPIMYFDKADQQDTFILIQLGFYADDKWLGSGILTITGTRYENPTYQRPNIYNIKFEGCGYFGSAINPFSSIWVGEREQGTNAIMLRVMESNTNKKLHYRVFHCYGVDAPEYVTSPVAYTQSQIYHIDDLVLIQSGLSCNNSAKFEGDFTVGDDFIIDSASDEVSGDAVDTTPTSGSGKLITSGGVHQALTDGSVTKIGTGNVGSATQPMYLENGEPKASDQAIFTTGKTFYVNGATGSDSNDGTAAHPFATIQKAVNACGSIDNSPAGRNWNAPGDSIVIETGSTYAPFRVVGKKISFNRDSSGSSNALTISTSSATFFGAIDIDWGSYVCFNCAVDVTYTNTNRGAIAVNDSYCRFTQDVTVVSSGNGIGISMRGHVYSNSGTWNITCGTGGSNGCIYAADGADIVVSRTVYCNGGRNGVCVIEGGTARLSGVVIASGVSTGLYADRGTIEISGTLTNNASVKEEIYKYSFINGRQVIVTGTPTNINSNLSYRSGEIAKSGNVVNVRVSFNVNASFTPVHGTKICDMPWRAYQTWSQLNRGLGTTNEDSGWEWGQAYFNGTTTEVRFGYGDFGTFTSGKIFTLSGTYLTDD